MKTSMNGIRRVALIAAVLLPNHVFAQATPPLSVCVGEAKAPACDAVRGDRADGWRAQSRAEVMAPHAMVATSQPLAAQAGLQMMLRGGNAIDAAVATAAVLNLVEPMMTGVAGDLFAVIYVAKEKKLYVLNASGMAPSGATVERFASLGYRADPANWGPGSGMPVLRHSGRNRAGLRLGMGGSAQAFRQAEFQGSSAAGDRLRRERVSGFSADRQ